MKTKKQPYPEWKKIAWRFGKVFVATFLVQFAAGLSTEQTMVAIAVSALSAGLLAVGKAFRSYIKENHPKYYNLARKVIV